MKLAILTSMLFLSSVSYSAEENLEAKKDFSVLCAVSKAAEALAKDKYVTDKAERTFLVWNMIEKSIKSQEVNATLKAVAAAEPSQKVKLIEQAAADIGLKNWKCKTLKYLF